MYISKSSLVAFRINVHLLFVVVLSLLCVFFYLLFYPSERDTSFKRIRYQRNTPKVYSKKVFAMQSTQYTHKKMKEIKPTLSVLLAKFFVYCVCCCCYFYIIYFSINISVCQFLYHTFYQWEHTVYWMELQNTLCAWVSERVRVSQCVCVHSFILFFFPWFTFVSLFISWLKMWCCYRTENKPTTTQYVYEYIYCRNDMELQIKKKYVIAVLFCHYYMHVIYCTPERRKELCVIFILSTLLSSSSSFSWLFLIFLSFLFFFCCCCCCCCCFAFFLLHTQCTQLYTLSSFFPFNAALINWIHSNFLTSFSLHKWYRVDWKCTLLFFVAFLLFFFLGRAENK